MTMRTSLSGLTGPVVTLTLPIFFLLFALPAKTTAQDLSFLSDTTHYLWPTDASPYISSTFGETRAAHFHAGLDIRTWGQEGYRVFATRDGIISRISTGPTGRSEERRVGKEGRAGRSGVGDTNNGRR